MSNAKRIRIYECEDAEGSLYDGFHELSEGETPDSSTFISAAALRELCDLLQVRACFFRSTSPENPVDAFRASEIETVVFELEKLLKGE